MGKMTIDERITRLERLEKLRFNLHGLLNFGWGEEIVAETLGIKNIDDFKQLKDIVENEIIAIQYNI